MTRDEELDYMLEQRGLSNTSLRPLPKPQGPILTVQKTLDERLEELIDEIIEKDIV